MTARPAASPGPVPVLFVHHGREWIRGSERCLLDLVAHLDPARFRPAVLCDTDLLASKATALGARTFRVRSWEDLPAARAATRAALAAHGTRVVHLNDLTPARAVLPLARHRRIPLLYHVHLPQTAEERRWGLLHLASAIVGVGASVLEGFVDDGVDPRRLHVVHNGVDPARVLRGDARGLRAALGIPPSAFVAASAASLIARKGHDVAISALARLRASGVDGRLVIVGDGEERDALAALAHAAGVGDAVHLLGERTDAGAVLRDVADVVVTAARAEAFPLNVLEAQLAGRAVVASDIPPHREALVDGETGLLVPGDQPDAFAAGLAALAADPERRARMGAAGVARVRERFLVDRFTRDIAARYDALLAQPRWRHGWLGAAGAARLYVRWVREAVGRRLRRLLALRAAPRAAAPTPGAAR